MALVLIRMRAPQSRPMRGLEWRHSLRMGRLTSMARKRKPLVVNDGIVELDAPGLHLVKRSNGDVQQYWETTAAARKRGYLPRTVRLHFDMGSSQGREALEQRCRVLTNEMLVWLGDPESADKPVYDGTLASLITCYQTDKKSPYRGLAQNTQRGYDDWCRTLDRAIGRRRIDRLTGQDLRDCFLALLDPSHPGGAPRVRLAQACVRSMLSILLNYGAELGLAGCLDLAQVLERMTLRVPKDVRATWKAKRPRKVAMSYDQATAIVTEGLSRGTRRHRSVALGVAAQFEFTLRQIDVIGEWERMDRVREVPSNAIVSHGQVWRPGIRFEQVAGGTLDLSTSKNDTAAVFDVTAYPLFMRAVEAVPEAERTGPLCVDDDGVPVRRRNYQDLYREVANAAGVPQEVWNMFARHGGVTEAHESGADLVDIGKHAQHKDLNTTNRHYIVPSVETSRRVARARVAHRQRQNEG
jgi:hypothetical protein